MQTQNNMDAIKIKMNQNTLNHMCQINFFGDTNHCRMVGIIATVGPSSRSVQMIYNFIKAGANMIRINCSHATQQEYSLTIKYIEEAKRKYMKETGYFCPLGVVLDLKGREIRTGLLSSKKVVEVKRGDIIKLSINDSLASRGTKEAIYIDYPAIIKIVNVGQHVFIDDNAIALEINEVGVDCLVCRILNDGQLKGNMSVVVPGNSLGLPAISEKDVSDIKFAIDNKVDVIFCSKLRNAEDVNTVRKQLNERGKHIKIFTKLENAEALTNLEEILKVSDGVVFARADLAIEINIGKIFLAQKAITARCNRLGKPIIIGTQLLMSMKNNLIPLRTDIADIGNAILDGADGLFLSSETAMGNYPTEAVRVLHHACKEAEAAVWHRKIFKDLIENNPSVYDGAHAMAISAVMISVTLSVTAIFVMTVSGKSAHLVSVYRPACPIFAITRCARVARQLNTCRGVIPLYITDSKIENRKNSALKIANRMGLVNRNDAVVLISPIENRSGYTHNVTVIYAQFDDNCNPI